MAGNKIITIARNDYYILEVNHEKNRAYLKLMGYWKKPSDLSDYIKDIKIGTEKMSDGFTLLVDLTQYNGTSTELHHLHVGAQRIAVKAGLSRAAKIFSSNPLLKLFFDSYSKESGANTMAFKDRSHAERWLDLY